MPFRLAVLPFVALSLALPAHAQTAATNHTSVAITAQDLKERLFALAHDSMGGRATGSLGGFKAADYVASEFRRLGLEPAGENGTYFQTIPFFRLHPDNRAPLTVDGVDLVLGRDLLPLVATTLPRPVSGALVIMGGMLADTAGWISAEQSRGRIVLLRPPPQLGRGLGQLFAPLRSSTRFAGAAMIVVPVLDLLGSELVAALLEGRIVTDTTRSGTAPLLALASRRAADRLLGVPVESAPSGTTGKAVEGSVSLTFSLMPYPVRNVVAILPGRDPALRSNYVSVTAHHDHVGFDHAPVDHDSVRAYNRVVRPMGADSPWREATLEEAMEIRRILDSLRVANPPRPDSIRNGADDDGTGTVGLLEIAERFAKGPGFKRSILFVSHAAEEMGLLGSPWFTDHPTEPIESVVSETDMDMIGRGSKTDLPDAGPAYLEMIGMRRLSTEYGDIIDRVNARQPQPFAFNLTYDQPGHPLQYYCRADHYSYARYGIPSVSLSRGEHLDYHQVTDEAQYIDYDALERVTGLVADVAAEIANLDHRPKLDKPKGDPRARCVQ